MSEQQTAKSKSLRKRLVAAFVIAVIALGLTALVMTTSAGRPLLMPHATNDLNREVAAIDAVLSKSGATISNGPDEHCGFLHEGRTENFHCMKMRDWQRDADAQFITNWHGTHSNLERVLNNNGWTKQANTDPLTQDLVKGLNDLVRDKTAYLTEVTYTKQADGIDCSIRFTVTPARDTSKPARFSAFEQCSSRFL